jgi:prephenate dehydratase
MNKQSIAIMGTRGSFHEEAAEKFFTHNDYNYIECSSFNEVCLKTFNNSSQFGVIAIENSIAGSILPNYALLSKYNLKIQGEIVLPIELHLLTARENTSQTFKTIYSHPMALRQCDDFLINHTHIKIIEGSDTGTCAKELAENPTSDFAVIASRKAADLYKLTIAKENVHNLQGNQTKFWVIAKQENTLENVTKSTISFETRHEAGSLAKVLNELGKRDVNLSRIQSVPIYNQVGQFKFYCDLEINNFSDYKMAIYEAAKKCKNLEILGEFNQHNSTTKKLSPPKKLKQEVTHA